MEFQERFSLEELAKRWNMEIDTIKEAVRTYQFQAVILEGSDGSPSPGSYSNYDQDDFLNDPDNQAKLEQLAKLISHEQILAYKQIPRIFRWNKDCKVFIPKKAVEQFEKENGLNPDHTSAPPTSNDFKWIHVDELRYAVECYYDLFVKNKIQPTGSSPKQQILKWLDVHPKAKKLSNNTKTKISEVVNPNKKGGQPKLQK